MMRLVITGGGGFLGYHLCHNLSSHYEQIVVLDICDCNPEEYPKNVRFVKADIRNCEVLNQTFQEKDDVIHAASALPLWRVEEIQDVNINGTRYVMEAALAQKVRRVLYVSSTAVYGVPKKHPIEEEDSMIGVGPYGESKIGAEEVCLEYRKKGLSLPIVRPKTFVGNGRLGVFQILYDWVQSGKKIPIIGNGTNRYQLLEVDDLTEAIRVLLKEETDSANDTFNVGADVFNTVGEDMRLLCDHAQTGARVLKTPAVLVKSFLSFFEMLRWSPLYKWVYETADKDSFVSTEKIRNRFGWKAKYSNAEALIRSYNWYLEHHQELSGVGVTHRVAWKQGVLALFKKIL